MPKIIVHKISGVSLRFLLVANVGCESLSSTVVMETSLPKLITYYSKQFRVMYIHNV